MEQTTEFSHAGWEAYYRENTDKRAWNGVPDEFLVEHLDALLGSGASNVLDVAAGDGRNSEPFLARGLNVVAVDLSPAALSTFRDRTRSHGGRNPLLLVGDFMSTPLLPGQFDCAVCFNSIPHFESPPAAIARIAALLAKGGRAAFNAFTPGDVAFGLGNKVGHNRFHYRDTLFTFMTQQEVTDILPPTLSIVHAETRRWQEPDHGSYRTGVHTHEACYFVVEKIASNL